jgi:protein KTI12
MPLIIVTGFPCSGKTNRSIELKDHFEKRFQDNERKVEIITEYDTIIKMGYDKNAFYAGQ